MKITNTTLAIILAFFVLILAAVVGLILAGREVDSVLYLIVAVLIPTVTSIIGARNAEQARKAVEVTSSKVDHVEQLVNGNTSRLLDRLEAYGEDVTPERDRLEQAKGRYAAD